MARYRKRPVEIEAIQWDGTNERSKQIRDWAEPAVAIIDTDHLQHLWDYDAGAYITPSGTMIHARHSKRCLVVSTLEGNMIAEPGDWIIKGVQGEFYPCKPEIFAATYDEVVQDGD